MNNGERGHEFLNFKTNISPFSSFLASKLIFKVLAPSVSALAPSAFFCFPLGSGLAPSAFWWEIQKS